MTGNLRTTEMRSPESAGQAPSIRTPKALDLSPLPFARIAIAARRKPRLN